MAAVHSRFARVVYLVPNAEDGALGSRWALHTISSLNHRFQASGARVSGRRLTTLPVSRHVRRLQAFRVTVRERSGVDEAVGEAKGAAPATS
jgi:hypothetical protein